MTDLSAPAAMGEKGTGAAEANNAGGARIAARGEEVNG